jgi:hypothetical protein
MAILPEPIICDFVGCGLTRTENNKWFVVEVQPGRAVHAYWWETAEEQDKIRSGLHFCGVAHAVNYVSSVLTFENSIPQEPKESTLVLKPPLARDGTVPDFPLDTEVPTSAE